MFLVLVLVTVGVAFCPLPAHASSSHDLFRLEREEAANRWAPLVWLHPNEDFFPSSVPHFLRHITLSTAAGRGPLRAMAQQGAEALELTLPGGRRSQDFFLTAQHDFGCLDCALPRFLRGEKPRKKYSPPVYVTVHACSPQPSGRTTRSTQDPSLDDDELINDRMSAEEVARDSTPTSFPYTGHTSMLSFILPSLPPTISHLTSNQDHTLPNISLPSNHSQTRQTSSLPSTSESTNPPSSSDDGNVTSSSPPICIHNSSLCNFNHSESMAPINIENIETAEHEQNLHTDGIGTKETTPMKTTETPGIVESQTVGSNNTGFLESSDTDMHQGTIEVNDTDDISDKSTSEQRHNNARRHARLGGQLLPYEQVYTLTYWMFYPYNKGKEVCTVNLGAFLGHIFKPRVKGLCHGEEITMGNHVGDWEHVSIQFKGSRPRRMYVSTHTFGAYYKYDPQSHTFVYESEDTREGIPMSPVYPHTIQLTGSHPILYSARGSHGLWGAEGVNVYNSFPKLIDETGRGTPWKTWNNLKLVDDADSVSLDPHRSWWRYEGRWGNPSSSCHLLLGGFCEHVNGPTGIPRKRVNFPCQRL